MSQEEEKSLSPLFTKMDALLARHRGPGHKDNEVLPVLTDIAEEEAPIPVLTEMASTAPAGSLMFDPHEFLAPPPPAPPSPMPVVAVRKAEPEFLDLPLLDLESLLRERAPFGPSHDLTIEPVADEAPAPAEAAAEEHAPTLVPGMDSESEALELAHAADDIPELQATVADTAEDSDDITTLHWEETTDPYDLYVASAAETGADQPPPPIEVAEVTASDAGEEDWSPVSPWWSDQPEAAADAETLAASAGAGFVEAPAPTVEPVPEPVAEHVPEPVLEPVAVAPQTPAALPEEEHATITLDWHGTQEPPLELNLDEFREEDSADEAPTPGLHEHIGNSVTELALPAGPADSVVEPDEPVVHEPVVAAVPAPAPQLDESAIIEMTASVAAHLAVDISTEVEQLTRRHFAHMMQTLYGEALTQLIDQVGTALEELLAPRIDKLVREELQARGLISPRQDSDQGQ
ncbi:hypothetical protein [Silvimonas iriomotensis]|uniref:DUF2497 domain-containing protein n=1 Tax=Silvimonas iriomotensis TaxID=449662 RepID=A0ABQ2PBL2_9NEIS|nr:hypothetical protein [Silvimonas iriomotensis]GGP22796.1 hypothetical protein GCM10010970_27960 [Silvimonas iriomotensis]